MITHPHTVSDESASCVFRVYNVETGKLKKCLKGSSSDEGALLKVQTHLLTVFSNLSSLYRYLVK